VKKGEDRIKVISTLTETMIELYVQGVKDRFGLDREEALKKLKRDIGKWRRR
jgi:hypothetical protein